MQSKNKIVLTISVMLLAALACSLPFSGGDEATEEPATVEPEILVVTATSEPEPTAAEPTAEQEAGISATANQNLNVRSGPSTQYGETSFINQGQTVPVIGKNTDGSWILISLPGGNTGWVSTPFTTVSGDLSTVTVINAPPPPTASSSGSTSPTATASSGGGASPTATSSGGGGGQTAPSDSNISTELNIKNGVVNENGVISYPNGDNQDQVFIKVVGFDSVTTSGDASFTLTCSGQGVENVQVFSLGGGDCNETWDDFFTNDSDQVTIRVYLESGSNAYVNWTLIVSANN